MQERKEDGAETSRERDDIMRYRKRPSWKRSKSKKGNPLLGEAKKKERRAGEQQDVGLDFKVGEAQPRRPREVGRVAVNC